MKKIIMLLGVIAALLCMLIFSAKAQTKLTMKLNAGFKKMNIPIAIPIRDEPWGDRHFAIVDPNDIGIDIVTYNPQTK
jgi:hypothetical protein